MIRFILNNQYIESRDPAGMTLLDFVRYESGLVGTKIGCREGDCGACTLLMGELVDGQMKYKSLTSCITPLGNAQGKHIVTIEGVNMNHLNPAQQAMVDESGAQCGFCTVGFIMSLTGELLQQHHSDYKRLVGAIDGNICRCTGYKAMERASLILANKLQDKNVSNPIDWSISHGYLPAYFSSIPDRIRSIQPAVKSDDGLIIGGGTDLLVQKHDEIFENEVLPLADVKDLIGIFQEENEIIIKAATNTTEMLESELMNRHFPRLYQHIKLVSSTPIRNIATIAGNIINASPIGDLTIFFLALDTKLKIADSEGNSRNVKLSNFYSGYKTFDMTDNERIEDMRFMIPCKNTSFNFEKVSKRRYLDIASVNAAISIKLEEDRIIRIHASAGGVGPVPLYLEDTCQFLREKELNTDNIKKSLDVLENEISPISDARGSANYKKRLLRQLFIAHFLELFPDRFTLKSLAS